jgi:hypothetical protein
MSAGDLTPRLRHGNARKGASTPAYHSWQHLRDRCLDPENAAYANYGGRGVTVCKGWLTFDNFLASMGQRPSTSHSIDRIENDLGYWCGACDECMTLGRRLNCRWATRREQANNQRTTVLLTLGSETLPLTTWADRYGLSANTIHARLYRGWDAERAVTTPLLRQGVA